MINEYTYNPMLEVVVLLSAVAVGCAVAFGLTCEKMAAQECK